eukprot:SAG11_NODE_429_length_9534_cov_14.689242_3_plen_93_part_00
MSVRKVAGITSSGRHVANSKGAVQVNTDDYRSLIKQVYSHDSSIMEVKAQAEYEVRRTFGFSVNCRQCLIWIGTGREACYEKLEGGTPQQHQ